MWALETPAPVRRIWIVLLRDDNVVAWVVPALPLLCVEDTSTVEVDQLEVTADLIRTHLVQRADRDRDVRAERGEELELIRCQERDPGVLQLLGRSVAVVEPTEAERRQPRVELGEIALRERERRRDIDQEAAGSRKGLERGPGHPPVAGPQLEQQG